MGQESKIAWCDSTVNFWSGCTKVSEGCRFCYAETLSNRFNAPNGKPWLGSSKDASTFGKWGKGAPRQLHESSFKLAAKLNRHSTVCDECGMAAKPDCECGQVGAIGKCHRRRIFSLSLGDWLDPEVPVEWLARMLDTVRQCPDVDWLLCTKRPELWRERLNRVAMSGGIDVATRDLASWASRRELREWARKWIEDEIYPENVVLLASVENQPMEDKRIPELLRIPAARRGLSCEPLLGEVEISPGSDAWEQLSWVIIGGESGHNARPCNVDWVRSLEDQCKAAGVPCFVKQMGANVQWPIEADPAVEKPITDRKGGDWNEWPDDLKVREFYR